MVHDVQLRGIVLEKRKVWLLYYIFTNSHSQLWDIRTPIHQFNSATLATAFNMAKLIQPESYHLAILILGIAAIMVILYLRTDYLPQLNPKTRFSNYSTSQYIHNARSLLLNWFDKHPNSPAVINSDYGRTVVLPPSMAGEIRNHPQLSHRKVAQEVSTTPSMPPAPTDGVDISFSFTRFRSLWCRS